MAVDSYQLYLQTAEKPIMMYSEAFFQKKLIN